MKFWNRFKKKVVLPIITDRKEVKRLEKGLLYVTPEMGISIKENGKELQLTYLLTEQVSVNDGAKTIKRTYTYYAWESLFDAWMCKGGHSETETIKA